MIFLIQIAEILTLIGEAARKGGKKLILFKPLEVIGSLLEESTSSVSPVLAITARKVFPE